MQPGPLHHELSDPVQIGASISEPKKRPVGRSHEGPGEGCDADGHETRQHRDPQWRDRGASPSRLLGPA